MTRVENVPAAPELSVTVMFLSVAPQRYVTVPVESSAVDVYTSYEPKLTLVTLIVHAARAVAGTNKGIVTAITRIASPRRPTLNSRGTAPRRGEGPWRLRPARRA